MSLTLLSVIGFCYKKVKRAISTVVYFPFENSIHQFVEELTRWPTINNITHPIQLQRDHPELTFINMKGIEIKLIETHEP